MAGEARRGASWWVTTWRTVQMLDIATWRKTRDSAPLRTLRWLGAIAVVAVRWGVAGSPRSAVTWMPVLVIVLLLLLPDAESIGIGSVTWKARREVERLENLTSDIATGTQVGQAAASAARSRSEDAPAADQALREFLFGGQQSTDPEGGE